MKRQKFVSNILFIIGVTCTYHIVRRRLLIFYFSSVCTYDFRLTRRRLGRITVPVYYTDTTEREIENEYTSRRSVRVKHAAVSNYRVRLV